MKRLSILFFLIALLIAGVTIAAVVVRANSLLAQRSTPAPTAPALSLSSN